jgi:acyl carrier protein
MNVRDKLANSFCRVFELDEIVLKDEMTANDVPGWDSLAHINLIMDIEEEFNVRFTVDDIADLKNVGEMIQLLERKVALG